MISLIKKPHVEPNDRMLLQDKNNYTTRSIDVRSTVKDFASSKGKQVVSSTQEQKNLLKRYF